MPEITSIKVDIAGETVFYTDGISPPVTLIDLHEIEIFNRDEVRKATFSWTPVLPLYDEWKNNPIEITINGETAFIGIVQTVDDKFDNTRGWVYGYTAFSRDWYGDQIPVVSPFDGTGTVTFNQRSTDPGYDPTYDGMSIGEMVRAVLEEPSTRDFLKSHNIGRYNDAGEIDARTVTDLETGFLDEYRPSDPVTFQGDQLFQAIRGILQSAAPNFRMWFEDVEEPPPDDEEADPVKYLIIRFTSIVLSAGTIDIDLSKNPMPQTRRDPSNCASRVIIRGGPDIRPVILDMAAGDLEEFFEMPPWLATNTAAKEAWNLGVWNETDPRKQIKGTCLCRRPRTTDEANPVHPDYIADPASSLLTDPGWLLVNPDDNTLAWGEDDYNQSSSGLAGFLYINRSPVTDWQDTVNRTVVYNSALVAAGTAYLQLNDDLAFTDYTSFTMIPGIWPGSLTWRRYRILKLTAQGESIAKRAQAAFPVRMPWDNTDGTPLSFTQSAVAAIYVTPEGSTEQRYATCGIAIDRLNEAIILDRPSVTFFGQPESLNAGGVDVDGQPENIRVLIPVSLGPLEVIEPPNDEAGDPVYSGSLYSMDSVARTLIINQPGWVSESDTGPMRRWAKQILESIHDTVVEGSAQVYEYMPVRKPGMNTSFFDECYATLIDFDGTFVRKNSQIYSCMLRFNHDESGVNYHTEFALSNRRDQYRGSEPATHPVLEQPVKPGISKPYLPGALMNRPDSAWQAGSKGFSSAMDRKS